jgi:zinc protease
MKKSIIILSGLFLSTIMQAQDRTQPVAGPAPTINIKKPESFTLPNGLKVLVVENHKLPRVSFSLSLDNLPYAEGAKKGVDDLTSALIGNGSMKIPKDVFNEEIDFLGAELNFYSSGASGSCLSKYAGRILELMADGALNPNFTQAEFDKEKEKLIESLKTQEKNVAAVAGRVQNVLAFGKNHPNGEFLTEETINNVTLTDVIGNYGTYFNPNNAYLVIIGDIKFAETKLAVEKLFGGWAKSAADVSFSYPNPRNAQYTQINFVDMPNAVQSEIALQNTVNLKMTDKDYFAAIVANQILGGDFNSYLNMNLREKHAWTYGARSGISGSKYVTRFSASTQVRNSVTDSAVVEFLKEFKRIRTEKVSDEALANVKAGYIGKFVMQIEKPQTVASYALKIKTQGLPEDFYENYIKNINAVTADDVLAAANKYFLEDNLQIVIVGKGVDVVSGLESLKIPIFYFDKYGKKTEKPVMKKDAPAGMTAKKIIDNYITAIGGLPAVLEIKSIAMVGSATIPQAPMPLKFVSKKMRGRALTEISMEGMGSVMKQVISEKGAYKMSQGQKTDVLGEELAEMRTKAVPFEEITLSRKPTLLVDGIELIDGSECYIIKNGEETLYFEVKTGLKKMETKVITIGDKKNTITTTYKDYKPVNGVKMPFEIVINQGMEIDIIMSEIKANEIYTIKDFQ